MIISLSGIISSTIHRYCESLACLFYRQVAYRSVWTPRILLLIVTGYRKAFCLTFIRANFHYRLFKLEGTPLGSWVWNQLKNGFFFFFFVVLSSCFQIRERIWLITSLTDYQRAVMNAIPFCLFNNNICVWKGAKNDTASPLSRHVSLNGPTKWYSIP